MKRNRDGYLWNMRKRWQLYMMALLPIVFYVIYKYGPMYGLIIAFKNYRPSQGIWRSQFVGLQNFVRFINMYSFRQVFWNTIVLSTVSTFAMFIVSIALSLVLHNCRFHTFKKVAQTTLFFPHFISTVVMVSILLQTLSPKFGIIASVVRLFGGTPVRYISKSAFFVPIYTLSELWQHAGWNCILFLAALTSVPISLHEAAAIDGASRFKRMWHIDVQTIMPTIIIMLIMNMAEVLGVGFEKVFLMQNDLNLSASEVIPTYVYKMGIANKLPDYSYATAIGLFTSVITFTLVLIVNSIAKKVSDISLW